MLEINNFQPEDSVNGILEENCTINGLLSPTQCEAPVNEIREENCLINGLLQISTHDFIFNDDPAFWDNENYDKIIEFVILQNFTQKLDSIDFLLSKKECSHRNYYATKAMFYTECANKELRKREWLIYSKSLNSVFCMPCILFSKPQVKSNFNSKTGFNDWSHANIIGLHEKSKEHQDNITKYVIRAKVVGKIDSDLQMQLESERNYWISILKRILSVVKFLSSRGLPFRGSCEKFGSSSNGNYLGLMELIAEYDPVLRIHIEKKGNAGSGITSYLSKTTCEEFIKLLAETVLENILKEIKDAKYFSFIVDSTPDISHTDQLTMVIRYVNPKGVAIERFIKFIPNIGHKAIDMLTCVLELFEKYDIDIMDCRGQSYDNASNMSGKYNGLQARIKEINSKACFVPCAAHSLNLVGVNAASCCLSAVSYFMFVQEIYNFFSASPHRWQLLKEQLFGKGLNLPKALSTTRWSARARSVEALYKGYDEFRTALELITQNSEENPQTKIEASGKYFVYNIYFIMLTIQ